MNEKITLKAKISDLNKRLDVFISEKSDITRSKAHKLIKNGNVVVNNKIEKKPAYLIDNENISIKIQLEKENTIDIKAEKIPLDIIFENKDVLVIAKPAGIVVHPDLTHQTGTLVNAALGYLGNDHLSHVGDSLRPGIVHRLDKDTSGVVIIAKNDKAHLFLADQFASRKVKKKYIALAHGVFKHQSGTIDSPISRSQTDRQKMDIATKNKRGKNAITHFKVLESFEKTTLNEVHIETGRTHQIRVHFAAIDHPIVGDDKYTKEKTNKTLEDKLKTKIPRIFLHAAELTILLPNEKEKRVFTTDLPKDLADFLKVLK